MTLEPILACGESSSRKCLLYRQRPSYILCCFLLFRLGLLICNIWQDATLLRNSSATFDHRFKKKKICLYSFLLFFLNRGWRGNTERTFCPGGRRWTWFEEKKKESTRHFFCFTTPVNRSKNKKNFLQHKMSRLPKAIDSICYRFATNQRRRKTRKPGLVLLNK